MTPPTVPPAPRCDANVQSIMNTRYAANKKVVADQHTCARPLHRRVNGSHATLKMMSPATPAVTLRLVTPIAKSAPATTAASAAVNDTAKTIRRVAGQAPSTAPSRGVRTNSATVAIGTANSPANSKAAIKVMSPSTSRRRSLGSQTTTEKSGTRRSRGPHLHTGIYRPDVGALTSDGRRVASQNLREHRAVDVAAALNDRHSPSLHQIALCEKAR